VSRSSVRPLTIWTWLLAIFVMEPAAFPMTRRMLLGLKERAETLAVQTANSINVNQRVAA